MIKPRDLWIACQVASCLILPVDEQLKTVGIYLAVYALSHLAHEEVLLRLR